MVFAMSHPVNIPFQFLVSVDRNFFSEILVIAHRLVAIALSPFRVGSSLQQMGQHLALNFFGVGAIVFDGAVAAAEKGRMIEVILIMTAKLRIKTACFATHRPKIEQLTVFSHIWPVRAKVYVVLPLKCLFRILYFISEQQVCAK